MNKKEYLYNLLSNDKNIKRFKNFYLIEAKKMHSFISQAEILDPHMITVFNEILYLNEKICKQNIKNEKHIKKSKNIDKYNRNLLVLEKYLKLNCSSDNSDILFSFKAFKLYGEIIQTLYKDESNTI